MKKLVVLVLIVAMLLSVAALADAKTEELGIPTYVTLKESDALKDKHLGCSIVYKGDVWCSELAKALEVIGEYYGAKITCEDGDLNPETQTKQVENMLSNGVDMIMIDPATPEGVTGALTTAFEQGLPIIIYDSNWEDSEEKALTYVSWDQFDTGRIVGRYFLDYIREHNGGKASIIELENVQSPHCHERFVGMHEVFDAAEDCEITVVNHSDNQGNREVAEKAVTAVVQNYDYIISDVDNGAQGALAALQQVGDTETGIFCMGVYGEEVFNEFHRNDPNYIAGLNVDPWVIAQFVYQAAVDYFEGNAANVAKQTNIDLLMVDSSNVDQFWSFE